MKAGSANNYLYNKSLQEFANDNRKAMTRAEARLWKEVLRARKLKGYGFRRQRPVLHYIADFMCHRLRLIIEVDGATHSFEDVSRNDLIRQSALESAGFTVLRFSDDEVMNDLDGVILRLIKWIENFEH